MAMIGGCGCGWRSSEQAYVLAVSGKEYVWRGWQQHQVKTVLAALPPDGWTRLSAGDGDQGTPLV